VHGWVEARVVLIGLWSSHRFPFKNAASA
jgi:hypothetical protein